MSFLYKFYWIWQRQIYPCMRLILLYMISMFYISLAFECISPSRINFTCTSVFSCKTLYCKTSVKSLFSQLCLRVDNLLTISEEFYNGHVSF